jgi:hypothetical protein
MSNFKNTNTAFLADTKLLIEHAAELPELAQVLAGYGYDAARFQQGQKLWHEAELLAMKQEREYGEQYEASKELGEAWAIANGVYMKTLKVARVVFADAPLAATSLRLLGPRKTNLSGWIEDATHFYRGLLADFSLMAAMGRFGYSPPKIQEEADLVTKLDRLYKSQVKESSEAQEATLARNRKFEELDVFAGELRTIARLAFHENPLELEKLGIFVRNSPKRVAKAKEEATVQGGA